MRPERFFATLLDLAKNGPGVMQVRPLEELGETTYPFALALTLPSGESRWQIMGQTDPTDRHEGDEPAAVTGEPPAAGADPDPAGHPEAWLAAVIARAQSPEMRTITRWSTREGERPGYYGITIDYYSGARSFIRHL